MKKRSIGTVAGVAAAALFLAGCSSSSESGTSDASSGSASGSGEVGTVGVILPDTATSDRWETADRPALTAAFENAGVQVDIQNAGGDKAKFATLCDQMINEGVSVLTVIRQ